ncbi:MAG: hypothetical protein EHM49_10035, partial [Deltaproteobacteria bacterium]
MGHFYDKDGNLIDKIEGANGNPRPTTLRDAKKLGLYPSVTELLKIFDKPQLDIWKTKEALLYSLENPKNDLQSTEDYVRVVMEGAKEKSITAADFGTKLHFAIETYLKTGSYEPEERIIEYMPRVISFLEDHKVSGICEQSVVNHMLGYGGKVDMYG